MSAGSWPGCRRVCPKRWGGGGLPMATLGSLPLALLLSACAGSPWGESLSGSFPTPGEPAPALQSPGSASPGSVSPGSAPSAAAGTAPPGGPQGEAPPASAPARQNKTAAKPGSQPPRAPAKLAPAPGSSTPGSQTQGAQTQGSQTQGATAPPGASSGQALPYRVILRLPRADPSAPAEAVTRALRAAGIPFEVETIERASGGATTPAVRPAPQPR
jgi:hypothetical protein